jgi:hypothetical protein
MKLTTGGFRGEWEGLIMWRGEEGDYIINMKISWHPIRE